MNRFRDAFLLASLAWMAAGASSRPVHASATAGPAQTDQRVSAPADDKAGAEAYTNHCAICHGEQREGILPAFPPLVGIGRQLSDDKIILLIHTGRGRMPAFPKLPREEVAALVRFLATPAMGTTQEAGSANAVDSHASGLTAAGHALFQQNCAFCHGRDAMGGETGPDLTRSKLVMADVGGDKISEVVRNGRPEKKMPAFNFSSQELLGLATFIHDQGTKAAAQKGGRRGVDVADLQTGNVEAGRQYFNGPGTCSKCHSATGDLAGVANRMEGLELEESMLYPRQGRHAKTTVTVTIASGQTVKGVLGYQDEFFVGLWQEDGNYRSWPKKNLRYVIDAPVQAHADLLSKYTDDDVHNLMAYLQTMH